jgi:hypothetical protein
MMLRRVTLILILALAVAMASAGVVMAEPEMPESLPPGPVQQRNRLVRFEGEIISRPATKVGVWVIGERNVTVVTDTEVNEEAGAAEVGARVLVVAKVLAGVDTTALGTVLQAQLIRVLKPRVVTIRGKVRELGSDYLVVNSLRIHYDATTVVTGELAVGALVKVTAVPQAPTASTETASAAPARLRPTYHALTIEVLAVAPPVVYIEFEGEIKSMGANSWEIGAHTVMVNRSTRISGRPAVGMTAKVRALKLDNGDLLALTIHLLNEPVETQFRGTIEFMPRRLLALTRPPLGEWVIGGRRVQVTSETEFVGTPTVGVPVLVTALQYPNRPLVAVKIEVITAAT